MAENGKEFGTKFLMEIRVNFSPAKACSEVAF